VEQHKTILFERKGEDYVRMVKVTSDSTVIGYGSKYYVSAEIEGATHILNYPKNRDGFFNATGKYCELVEELRSV
jgi:prefoldin subunit 5